MSSAKRLNDYLPTKICTTTTCVQAKIPTDLHGAVKLQMQRDIDDGIPMNWNELFVAFSRAYLAERGAKKIP